MSRFGSPDALQHAVFDNAPLAAQHVALFPVAVHGSGFDRGEAVSGADGVEVGLAHARIGEGRQVVDAPTGQLAGLLETELPGQGIVALRKIAVPVDLLELLLLG